MHAYMVIAVHARAQECYQLVCVDGPKAGCLKAAAALLQTEVQERRRDVAAKEAALATHNPPAFQAVQVGFLPSQP